MTLAFAAGYLTAWIGFSTAATLAQWALDGAHMLPGTLAIHGKAASGLVLIAIGLYQVSPWKHVSLQRCRGAVNNGTGGAGLREVARQGVGYGRSCLACCLPLMGLLFIVGVMNVLWVAVIAAWVVVEKTLAWGDRIATAGGAGNTSAERNEGPPRGPAPLPKLLYRS